jgi:hypothetical protein
MDISAPDSHSNLAAGDEDSSTNIHVDVNVSSIESQMNVSEVPTDFSESDAASSHPSKEGENDVIPLPVLEHLAQRDGPIQGYINSDGEGHNGGYVADSSSGVHSNADTVFSDVYDSDDHAL